MNLIKKLLTIGISKVSTSKEKKRVRVLNLIVLICLLNVVFFFFFDFITGTLDIHKTTVFFIETLVFIGIIYMQGIGMVKLSRILFTIIVFWNLFYHCNVAFKGYYGEYQYIIIPLFALFFFDKSYVHYTLLTLAIIAFYVPNIHFKIYPEKYFGYMNTSLLFAGVFFIVNYFKTLNQKNEGLLLLQKNQAIEDKLLLISFFRKLIT